MGKEKEKAYNDYIEILKNSWTFQKLTEKEKENLRDILFSVRLDNALKGTYKQRRAVLDAVYFAFLKGLDCEPIGWRENGENCANF